MFIFEFIKKYWYKTYVEPKILEEEKCIKQYDATDESPEFIEDYDVDAFVTGDLKFHTALDSKNIVFDIGHFESEILILEVFKEILGIDVTFAKENSPFIY